MTDTAYIIARMEAAESAAEQASIQSKYPMDAVFRDVLSLAYDPYEQFGAPLGLEDPEPIDDIEAVDAALDEDWFTIAGALRTGLSYERAVADWRKHAAWPVVQRVLQKRFVGVTFATANSVWGTLPLFDAGDVSDEPVTYPCVAVPVFSRHRRLVVVRPVTYLPDARARVDVFDRTGQCCATILGDVLPRRLKRVEWDLVLSYQGCEQGIVLDGWIDDAQEVFSTFDCVPLAVFREQHMTRPYTDRQALLSALDVEKDGLRVQPTTWLGDEEDLDDKSASLLASANALGVIGVDPTAPYPYRASHAWRWIYRPGTR